MTQRESRASLLDCVSLVTLLLLKIVRLMPIDIISEMRTLLEGYEGKQYRVREPDTIALPELKLKPGDVIRVAGRLKGLLLVTRVSDGAQASISQKFLDRMIALMQLVEVKPAK